MPSRGSLDGTLTPRRRSPRGRRRPADPAHGRWLGVNVTAKFGGARRPTDRARGLAVPARRLTQTGLERSWSGRCRTRHEGAGLGAAVRISDDEVDDLLDRGFAGDQLRRDSAFV